MKKRSISIYALYNFNLYADQFYIVKLVNKYCAMVIM